MATYDDVARLASALPEVEDGSRYRGHCTWAVRGKVFAWERPFSKADLRRFGDAQPPAGPILALAVEDLDEKEAVLAARPGSFFTIEHFDGYAAVLVRLDAVGDDELAEALEDAWLAKAPADLAETFRGR
ncbi:MmcQ/YjbR family DNA-binding protein [Isoptericola variabilis]|uniref:MmcQ/YjbR family DNA-binding protein n=1 Tax=Isoptericola variabilis (strain 225) TaxID=743718 RepID=F6FQX0_ISOV2|nr:MmcQ/YjbR family DNA-binding protein [Isoptericola variabilis]AEG43855.1 protein of unknown function DUF661 [Isoptericola variabilis 225]TWH34161.1 hypothetical protein L600_001300000680 [Isoptericola variabilis J7]